MEQIIMISILTGFYSRVFMMEYIHVRKSMSIFATRI